ncbi:Rho guanine nucleotide exchange factor 7, partial [Stegodyphus mimosarum]
MIQRIVVVSSSAEILNQWLNSFRSNNVKSISPTSFSRPSTISRHSPSHTTPMRTSISPNSSVQGLQSVPPHPSRSISPDDKTTNPNRIAAAAWQVSKKVWPNWNLRPHPPMRASLTTQSEVKLRRSNSCKKEKDHESEGDLPSRHMKEVLSNCDRTRNTVHSATASAPPRLNFEEDKIIIDDDDSQEVKERTLVDTVYMLKDQIQELKSEISSLRKTVNEDRLAMRKLEMLVKQHILQQQENHLVTSLEG